MGVKKIHGIKDFSFGLIRIALGAVLPNSLILDELLIFESYVPLC